jgi:hypothetical protein
MFVPSSAGPATNGTSPMDLESIATSMIARANINRGVAAAYRAVYGNCTPPGSYAAAGVNLMGDIAAAPSPASAIASATQASAFTGQAVTDLSDAPAQTVPLNGDGSYSGLPAPPAYPSLWTSQPVVPPVVPANTPMPQRAAQTCPTDAAGYVPRKLTTAPGGVAPGWGNAFSQLPLPQAAGQSGLVGWIQDNPLLALGLAVGGFALLTAGGGSR